MMDVVQASVVEPIIRAIPCSELWTERLLDECDLAPQLLEDQRGIMPLYAGERFLCALSRKLGDNAFNYRAGAGTLAGNEDEVAHIPLDFSVTGLDAAKSFVGQLDRVLTGTRFFWTLEGRTFWMLRTTGTTDWSDLWPVAQYNLSVMLTGMRRLFGHSLKPTGIRLGSDRCPEKLPDDLAGLPLQTAAPYTGLGFDIGVLVAANRPHSPGSIPSGRLPIQELSDADTATITACLRQYLYSERTDRLAERAARAFGVSLRTYQRRLSRLGTSHSHLVADARLAMAFQLLSDADRPITAISLELGYASPGDFTRFFKSRTGVTPSTYRAGV
jgi:AraC-like DNA-binding protein